MDLCCANDIVLESEAFNAADKESVAVSQAVESKVVQSSVH